MFKYQCPRSGNTIDRLNGAHSLGLHNPYKSTAVCRHRMQSSLLSESFVRYMITLGSLHLYAHKLSTFILNTTIFRILVLGTFSGYVYSEFPVTHSCCVRPSQFVCCGRDEKEKKCSQFQTDLATCLILDIMKDSDSYRSNCINFRKINFCSDFLTRCLNNL